MSADDLQLFIFIMGVLMAMGLGAALVLIYLLATGRLKL